MSELLSELLSTGGRSLEQEEVWLRSEARYKGGRGGILAIDEICFCPYVFGRAIPPKFDAKLRFTLDGRRVGELAVTLGRKRFALILDHWKDEPRAALQEDVDRLAKQKAEAFLLVLSANPCGQTESRMDLIDALPGVGPRTSVYRFSAETGQGEEYEFWVGAWPVARKRSGETL